MTTYSLTGYLATLDAARLQAFALPDHALKTEEPADRQLYLSQLALLLLAGDGITAEQQRLFSLLLPALGVTTPLAELMALAQHTTQTQLEAFIALVRAQQLESCFIVEALLLCRIGQPLNRMQSQILSELAVLLQIGEADIEQLAQISALILGIDRGELLPLNISYTSLKLHCWQAYLRRELTADILRAGADNGFWYFNKPLDIDFSWSLHSADIDFGTHGALRVTCPGDIRLSDCVLHQPRMSFSGSDHYQLSLMGCTLRGDYALSAQETALETQRIRLKVRDCYFATRNARALRISSGQSSLKRCVFSGCGHPQLVGGAIASHSDDLYVGHSEFTHCRARVAGGIRADKLTIAHSQFDHCLSEEYAREKYDLSDEKQLLAYANGAGGILCGSLMELDVQSCQFTLSSIKSYRVGYGGYRIKNSTFVDSAVSCESDVPLITEGGFSQKMLNVRLGDFRRQPAFTAWQNNF